MQLDAHVDELRTHLTAAAEAGDDANRAVVERLVGALDAATRLVLLDVVGEVAAEVTCELAPGSVEVRLRGREPELLVTPPPVEDGAGEAAGPAQAAAPDPGPDDGAMTRINLRLADHLKVRVEAAADREGVSTNAWLVRAATAALDDGPASRRSPPARGERFKGWAR